MTNKYVYKMNYLKQILPSGLLILAYFLIEKGWGPIAGMFCALVLGCGEYLYTWFREKKKNNIILIITLFFCLPGLLAWYNPSAQTERYQSILTEIFLGLLCGIFAFSKADLSQSLPTSFRKKQQITPEQIRVIRYNFRLLFYLLCFHICIAFVALFLLPEYLSDFVNGPLLYIFLGGFFLCLFLFKRWQNQRYRKEEWLPLVDEKGEITGSAPRSICHSGTKLLHPVVHLHITNEKGEIFLQKRSLKKDLLPGKWDTAVGGHIGLHEKIEAALKRETFEELGITEFEARFLGNYIWESSRERELVFSFLCTRYNRMHIENEEVEEGRFWNPQEIEEGIRQQLLTPNFVHEYQHILSKLKTK